MQARPVLLWKIFAVALAIRWAYALAVFAAMGENGLKGPDSYSQLANAHAFAAAIAAGTANGWDWLGPSLMTMPLFNWLIALHALAFGSAAPLTYVLMQGAIDAGTCLLIYSLAATLSRDYALPAALAAAINPTQIVLSGLVYTDTPFVFCVALFLLASARWLRTGGTRWAVLLGIGLGAAALIRVVAVPFAPLLLLLLLIGGIARHGLAKRTVGQLAAAAAIIALCVAPLLARSVTHYGTWSLTSQGGAHFALWVVPLVKEAKDGTPWARTFDAMEKRTRERFGAPVANPYEESRRYTVIGREAMAELGAAAMVKAWLFGAAINLAAPAIILSPPISQLPRTGFYATTGGTILEKVANFLFRSENAIYAWALLLGVAGVAVMRLIQLIGAATIPWTGGNWAILILFGAWIVYILMVNGPIASPKYRLPIEPVLMVLTGAGLFKLRTWWRPLRARR